MLLSGEVRAKKKSADAHDGIHRRPDLMADIRQEFGLEHRGFECRPFAGDDSGALLLLALLVIHVRTRAKPFDDLAIRVAMRLRAAEVPAISSIRASANP